MKDRSLYIIIGVLLFIFSVLIMRQYKESMILTRDKLTVGQDARYIRDDRFVGVESSKILFEITEKGE